MGARLRLKASKDLSRLPPEVQKIFRAMQRYGLIVADNGSDMFVSGAFDPRWNNDVLNPAFRALTASDFEVVDARLAGHDHGSVRAVRDAVTVQRVTEWPLRRARWAGVTGANDYVIEVGSSTGGSDLLVAEVGAVTSVDTVAPPGIYFVRVRARNACGAGSASNEVVVTIS